MRFLLWKLVTKEYINGFFYSYLKLAKENRHLEKNESIKTCYCGLMHIINL